MLLQIYLFYDLQLQHRSKGSSFWDRDKGLFKDEHLSLKTETSRPKNAFLVA